MERIESRNGCREGDCCGVRMKGCPGGEAVRGGIRASGGDVNGFWLLKGKAGGACPGEGMGDSKRPSPARGPPKPVRSKLAISSLRLSSVVPGEWMAGE